MNKEFELNEAIEFINNVYQHKFDDMEEIKEDGTQVIYIDKLNDIKFSDFESASFTLLRGYGILEYKYKELHNKIDKLLKENESLRARIKTIKRLRKKQTHKKNKYKSIIIDLQNALTEKNNKIDKAIEYIKEKVEEDEKCTDIKFLNFGEGVDYDLLKILKDSDVDDNR